MILPATADFRLTFAAPLTSEGMLHVRNRLIGISERPDFGTVTLCITSPGGDTVAAVGFYNFIRELPFSVSTHAQGHVGSAANIIYLAGEHRTACPGSRFFFHQYDWGFDARQTPMRLDEATQLLNHDIKTHRAIISERSNAPKAVLDTLDGSSHSLILEPEQAVEAGIAHEVKRLPQSNADGRPIYNWT